MTFEEKRDEAARDAYPNTNESVEQVYRWSGFRTGADWAKRELGWQPMTEIPEKNRRVFVMFDCETIETLWFDHKSWESVDKGDLYSGVSYLGWMYVPKLEKENEG